MQSETPVEPRGGHRADVDGQSIDDVILSVSGLSVSYGAACAVSEVSFDVRAGETVAIVGESGSGKSTVANAVLGLLPPTATVTGDVSVCDESVVGAREKTLRELRRTAMAYVPQDPMSNLNPVLRVGSQVAEVGNLGGAQSRAEARRRAVTALEDAGLEDADARYRQFPHQMSGGMRQRALIAMGLINGPRLLIADEPTSALDVTVQRVILDNMAQLVQTSGTTVLLITHDLGLAAERADRVIVMRHGRVVEQGPARDVLLAPEHEYTQALIAAAPGLTSASPPAAPHDHATPVLAIEGVSKTYRARGRGRQRIDAVTAVEDVSFEVHRGRTLAIVGESGSGKSTAASIALRLTDASSGCVRFDGEDITIASRRALMPFRRRVQPVFQDPYASLDPMATVQKIIEEPLRAFGLGDAVARERRVRELLEVVGLAGSYLSRSPHELSGGQRQRVAIARALAPEPEVVVCDEAVSALDVLVQASVLDTLRTIQDELGVAYLFISHDLGAVKTIAHEVLVMRKGRVVERGQAEKVFAHPKDDYTRALFDAVPGRSLLDAPPDAA